MTRLRKIFKRFFNPESKPRSQLSENTAMGDARTSKTVATLPAQPISAILDDPMRRARKRFESFRTNGHVLNDLEQRLAAEGFFYNRDISKIQCFSCGVRFPYPLDCTLPELVTRHPAVAPECEFTRCPSKAGNINDMNMSRDETATPSSRPNSTPVTNQNERSENNPGLSNTNPPPQHPVDSSNNVIISNQPPMRNTFNRATIDYPRLKSEEERLKTFRSVPPWPVPFIQPEDCARAGFFFVGDADKVQCAFCRGVAGEWEEGDIPWMEHQRHFPRCPFICNLPVGNIPINGEDQAIAPPPPAPSTSPGYDVCGPFGPESMGVFRPGSSSSSSVGAQPYTSSMQSAEDLKIKPFRGPANTKMVSPQARLKTFTNGKWPTKLGLSPEQMAEAGFYYTGTEDQVKCFYCDGGLKNWVATDDPWIEHAKWFPFCTHVTLLKGDEFVRKADAAASPSAMSSGSSSDEDVTNGVEAMEIEKDKVSSGASSSGVESSSERGLSPVSTFSSGEEDNEPSTSTRSSRAEREPHSQLTCKICMDNEVGVVFLPCGHLVSCPSCATACKSCAVCRQRIHGVVRAYLS